MTLLFFAVDVKEVEKIQEYLDLFKELKNAWNMKMTVVPLVTATLDNPTKTLEKRLKSIGIDTNINKLQKTVLIHTSRILLKALELWQVLLTPYLKNKSYPLVETNVRLVSDDDNNDDSNNNNKFKGKLKKQN